MGLHVPPQVPTSSVPSRVVLTVVSTFLMETRGSLDSTRARVNWTLKPTESVSWVSMLLNTKVISRKKTPNNMISCSHAIKLVASTLMVLRECGRRHTQPSELTQQRELPRNLPLLSTKYVLETRKEPPPIVFPSRDKRRRPS